MSDGAETNPRSLPATGPTAITGHELLVRSLARLGVTHAYSVSGTPIVETLAACVGVGIRPVGVRNEQAGALMAAAHSYAAGRLTAVALLGSGPAITNAVTGTLVARDNRWPLVVIGGSCPSSLVGRGAFQELQAEPIFRPITKWSTAIPSTEAIPNFLGRAFRAATDGAPGPVYLDVSRDVLIGKAQVPEDAPPSRTGEPAPRADPGAVREAGAMLRRAERPLLILGEGVRWTEPTEELAKIVETLRMPFITSPMGRGLLPDDHVLCFNAARTAAQNGADLVLLAGASLNWLFLFGDDLNDEARIVRIVPARAGSEGHREADVDLVGDERDTLRALLGVLEATEIPQGREAWLATLEAGREENRRRLQPLLEDDAVPITPHRLVREVRDFATRDATVVVDGNIIMAAARQGLPAFVPASRLNCGVTGCVGVGIPFAIAAKLARPERPVVCLIGDSAFGFCAMELETAVRNRLAILVIVANNDGIGGHRTQASHYPADYSERVTTFQPDIHYEKIMEAFGGHFEYVDRPENLAAAFRRAAESGTTACINVRIDPFVDLPTRGRAGALEG